MDVIRRYLYVDKEVAGTSMRPSVVERRGGWRSVQDPLITSDSATECVRAKENATPNYWQMRANSGGN